jgi:hypothetical protein
MTARNASRALFYDMDIISVGGRHTSVDGATWSGAQFCFTVYELQYQTGVCLPSRMAGAAGGTPPAYSQSFVRRRDKPRARGSGLWWSRWRLSHASLHDLPSERARASLSPHAISHGTSLQTPRNDTRAHMVNFSPLFRNDPCHFRDRDGPDHGSGHGLGHGGSHAHGQGSSHGLGQGGHGLGHGAVADSVTEPVT